MIHSDTLTTAALNEIIADIDNIHSEGQAMHGLWCQPYTNAYAALQLIARQTEMASTMDTKPLQQLIDNATDSIADFQWDHGDIIPQDVFTLISSVKQSVEALPNASKPFPYTYAQLESVINQALHEHIGSLKDRPASKAMLETLCTISNTIKPHAPDANI